MQTLIPKPSSLYSRSGTFSIPPVTNIKVGSSDPELSALAEYLKEVFTQATQRQCRLDLVQGDVQLFLNGDPGLGEEGYELSIQADGIRLSAPHPAGLFYGIQTLRQLLPPHPSADPVLPAVSIRDSPRFAWRGAMLDVARHFFRVEDVKRYIDLISHYKMNRLHLHLTDDQGWRIEIKSWPALTEIGARTQVNGGGGGFYTQEQFKEIADYARSRCVTVIPEVDAPGHVNAALASYPELNCDDNAPGLYEGIEVGFSSLCIDREITYQFLDDVIRELSALTPGPYVHIGGDEAKSTPEEEYKRFIQRVQQIVFAHGKIPVGWAEIGEAELDSRTIAQHWMGAAYQGAKAQGCRIVLSPANKAYLDMKYDDSTPLGLIWAGAVSVKDSYDWEPGNYVDGLNESDILGIEAPLWTETLVTIKDIEFMAFPRLPGLAERAWSPAGQAWGEYKHRLAAHEAHMEALGIHFFRSPHIER